MTAHALSNTSLNEPDRAGKMLRAATAVFVVLLILAMFPFTPDPTGDIKILIYQLAAFLLGTTFFILNGVQQRTIRRPRVLFHLLLAYLGVHLLAASLSQYAAHSLI